MPTRTRRGRSAPADRIIDLAEAGPRVGYAPEYLRKLLRSSNPPPLFKRRDAAGRWKYHARTSELDAWVAARAEEVAS